MAILSLPKYFFIIPEETFGHCYVVRNKVNNSVGYTFSHSPSVTECGLITTGLNPRELQTCKSEVESRRKLWDHVQPIDYGFSMRLPIVRYSVLADLLEDFTVVLNIGLALLIMKLIRILHRGIQKGKVTML